MNVISLTFAALIAVGGFASAQQTSGEVQHEFKGGFPTAEASAKSRDEADFDGSWKPSDIVEVK